MPSKLPLSFLCWSAKENEKNNPGAKFQVHGYEGTHRFYRKESGRLTFTHNNLPRSYKRMTDGWQFFISVLPEDRDKAWHLITPFLLTQDSPVLAFSVDDSKVRGLVPEEAFVLYTFRSRSGRLLQSSEAIFKLCQDIDKNLLDQKIRTCKPYNAINLQGLHYVSMDYIEENIRRNQEQSDLDAGNSDDPYREDNPYQRFTLGRSKRTFFATSATTSDIALLRDDTSVVSDLTC